MQQAHKISGDLRSSQFVRLPIDSIVDEAILIYPYLTEDLMSVVQKRELPKAQTKRILLDALRGLKELHDRNWVHTGMKPAPHASEYYATLLVSG
jgi:serine/threonine protein kinase